MNSFVVFVTFVVRKNRSLKAAATIICVISGQMNLCASAGEKFKVQTFVPLRR